MTCPTSDTRQPTTAQSMCDYAADTSDATYHQSNGKSGDGSNGRTGMTRATLLIGNQARNKQ